MSCIVSGNIGMGDENYMRSLSAVMKSGSLQNDTPLMDSKIQSRRASMYIRAIVITSRVEMRYMYATDAQMKSEATWPS